MQEKLIGHKHLDQCRYNEADKKTESDVLDHVEISVAQYAPDFVPAFHAAGTLYGPVIVVFLHQAVHQKSAAYAGYQRSHRP